MTTTTSPFFPSLVMQVWGAPGRAQYVGHPRVWEDVGAQNIFTPESFFAKSEPGGHTGQFHISLSVSGTFAATVTLQRSFDNGVAWHDVEQYTDPTEKFIVNSDQSHKWRLGVKTGDYTSGSALCQLNQ